MHTVTYHFWVGEGEERKPWEVQYKVEPGPHEGETRLTKVPGSERPCTCAREEVEANESATEALGAY